jgi:hypothetical protein
MLPDQRYRINAALLYPALEFVGTAGIGGPSLP